MKIFTSSSLNQKENKMQKIKSKLAIGFVIGTIGLIILILNAFEYLSNMEVTIMSSGASIIFGLLFCIIGATLLHINKKTPQSRS